ncbi:74L protein [Yaba-like disease virus]|uniref:74L protein n=1 Tax=Yaba-like disease virus TaxID=132475 RepID=Q9DHN9_YLDV|nr:74L protein [Yaba-like disease virus]CAC21312.1 74L protein [Yaba-like disease virus]
MAKNNNEMLLDVPIYIIPIVNRGVKSVIPEYEADKKNVEIDEIKDDSKSITGKDLTAIAYEYYIWKRVEHSGGIESFKDYFSSFCNIICSQELKTSVSKHFSLWEQYAKANIKDPEKKFFVVLEDDNTLHDLTTIHVCISSMIEKNIDILQLREIMYNNNVRTLLNPGYKQAMYSYTGGYDFSLSAYIIRVSTAIRFINEIKSKGGVSASLNFELSKIENDLKVNRQVLNDSSIYVTHDARFVSYKRVDENRNKMLNKIENWIAGRFPNAYYTITHPLFSFFGLFDINIVGMITILLILILFIFEVNSKLLWFLSGAMFSYVI